MIRSICKALTVAAGLAVIASVAMAGVPDPSTSTNDGDLMIGNARGGALVNSSGAIRATVLNGYQVIVKDNGGTVLPGVNVTMNFAGSGIRVHSTQQSGQTASCAGDLISKITDGAGSAIFFPATVGVNHSSVANVQVRANGVLLTTIKFHSVDLSCLGTPGKVEINDFNEFRKRFIPVAPNAKTDPETDYATEASSAGTTDVSDFNVFRTEFLCGLGGGTAPAPCTQTQCAVCP